MNFKSLFDAVFDQPLVQADSEKWFDIPWSRPPAGGAPTTGLGLDVLYSTTPDYSLLPEQHSWVLACIRAIYKAASTVPLRIQESRKTSAGIEWIDLERESIVGVLSDFNPVQGPQEVFEYTAGFLSLEGKCFWELVRNKSGKVQYIYPLNPVYTRPIRGKQGRYIDGYVYQDMAGNAAQFEPQDILFFRFWHPRNDYDGLSPLQAVQEGIQTDFYAQQYNKAFFKNDATPKGTLETERSLSPRAWERVKTGWKQAYGGAINAHSIAVLEEGLKFKPVAINPREMEFLKLRKFTREEILAVFGVYPVVMGLLEGATYANAQAQKELFYEHTISLYLAKIEEPVTRMLRRELGRYNVRAHFDLSQVAALRPLIGAVMEWAVPAVSSGIVKINEVRRLIGYPPVPWGETYFGNMAMVPLADDTGVLPQQVLTQEEQSQNAGLYQVLLEKLGKKHEWEAAVKEEKSSVGAEMVSVLGNLNKRLAIVPATA